MVGFVVVSIVRSIIDLLPAHIHVRVYFSAVHAMLASQTKISKSGPIPSHGTAMTHKQRATHDSRNIHEMHDD